MCREVMDTKKNIIRLIEIKKIWKEGKLCDTEFHLRRAEQQCAAAWYLFEPKRNTDPCQQCAKRNSKGPFVECVASSSEVGTGACFNCYYSGTSMACSIRRGKNRAPE
ncbi:hypothetical protein F4802DRAFT_558080 [Xylaria palmicola]|nr:hypothetical protein F4802DRAFT_558080 [Xylaria palmicola]